MRRCVVSLMVALAVTTPGVALGYDVVQVKDGGTLTGSVKFVGAPPKLAPIPVKKNQDLCGKSVASEALVLGPNKGVRYAVIWIEGIAKGKKIEKKTVVLDNTKCLFVPHVLAVTAATKTRVRNSDPILHNTHGFLSKRTVFNLALPLQDQVLDVSRRIKRLGRKKRFGVMDIQCDAHTHMKAWMVVRPDPYFAVTDERGRFKVTDIPPGTYKVVAWHESWEVKGSDKDGRPIYGEPVLVSQEVAIPPRGEANVAFEFK
ncbi:MAG: carboxypeptidase regulatory-like domain-containing protein [Candidatus Methylomirabilales bacterium]